MIHCIRFQIILLLTLGFASQAFSQSVSIQFQQKTGYVGVPIPLYVVFENITGTPDPSLPEIDGFSSYKQLGDRTSTQTTFINGKMTSTSSRIVTFMLTPERIGTFTIPGFTFEVDGKAFHSTPRTFSIEEPPTSGVLEAEIVGTTGAVYLGRPIDLTLSIFMEAFIDPTNGITPDAQFMFQRIRNDSNFGVFTEALQDGNAKVQRVQGTSKEGIPTSFFVFTVQATAWPETTGKLHLSPITILADYPLAVSRPRRSGFFGSNGPRVEQAQLISATASAPEIEVLTPPSEGKPAWFSGAVGHFDFRIVATPLRVKVGEPITITMRVTDLTSGPVNLDYLSAPLLDRVSTLSDNFKVPDKLLGGTVNGRTKIFTQTIRPRNDSPNEIPSLPFTSYDPVSGEYLTSWSKPIPISVEAVQTVSANDLIGETDPTKPSTSLPTEVEGGILANYPGSDLLHSEDIALTPTLIVAIAVPPVAFFAILLFIVASKRARQPSSKRKGAMKRATRTLRNATKLGSQEQATEIATAIRTLQETKDSDAPTSKKLDALLKRCNASQFGGIEDATLASDAVSIAEQLT